MNVSHWIESIITGNRRLAVPVMTNPGISLIGRTVLDAVTDGEVHFQTVKALNDRFPFSAACTMIMDLTVEAEAFGAQIQWSRDEVPSVTGRLLQSFEDVRNLNLPDVGQGRIPEYLKADRLAAAGIEKPVFAGCIGPFSLAGRLYDLTEILMAIYTEPETAVCLLEKCTEFLILYCKAIKETGVAGVIIAEPAAGLISNEDCCRYSSVYVRKIVQAVQDDTFAVILHNCGNTGHCTEAMVMTGAKGYHFGNKADMVTAIEACPSDTLVMGNIDPVEIFKMGSPETVYDTAYALLESTKSFRNFIISSGCDIPPGVSMDNVDAFYRAVKHFNEKYEANV